MIHEINTPLNTGITADSGIPERTAQIAQCYADEFPAALTLTPEQPKPSGDPV